MNRYAETLIKWEDLKNQEIALEEEYKSSKKGDIYTKRKLALSIAKDDLKHKALNIGTQGNICHVYGKRSRPSIKNASVLIQESFNLYFINVSMEEASALVGLHIPNVISFTIKFIRPGVILTS